MRLILFFLLLFSVASAQTVHVEDDKIVYKGKVRVEGAHEQLVARATQIIHELNEGAEPEILQTEDGTKLSSEALFKLQSPDRVSKKVKYLIQIEVKKESYEYCIDSVYFLQKEPGHKTTEESSKELLLKMESSGPVAASTEQVLNETDMNFQKIIDRINKGMTGPSGLVPR